MTPNQDRGIRPTHVENRFGIIKLPAGTIHGRHSPRIGAQTVLRCLRENYIRLRRGVVGPVRDNRKQRLELKRALNHTGASWSNQK